MNEEETYKQKYKELLPTLPERSRRLVAAADAKSHGYGGVSFICRTSGMSRSTIKRGVDELTHGTTLPPERNRRSGAGRKKITETDKSLKTDLLKLAEDSAKGDPKSPLQWIDKSTRTLSTELGQQDHKVSYQKVRQLLRENDYRLQGNVKSDEGTTHPDRDVQFRYIAKKSQEYLDANNPVISVDTKKKELIGNYKNNGQTWLPKGKPIEVNVHDFPDPNVGKAVPYGTFDLGRNEGYVNVGINHDTGEFAVASIKRWWERLGKNRYPKTKKILITADAGGSNGYRLRLWKKELQEFADQTGLAITVCHFPPGTSKWNKIEHRLFSFISINWKGKPLTSYEVIVNLIAHTKTNTGLKVYAALDDRVYELKKKVADREMKLLKIEPHEFHGEWNYTIKPRL
jgi:hypothetical protein